MTNAPQLSFVFSVCTAAHIDHAFKFTNQTEFNYNTQVVYACETGYRHTFGDLNRICLADGEWSGKEPVCTSKSMPANPTKDASTSTVSH